MISLRALAEAIRSGELSPAEHVRDVLDRLAADTHNAVVELDAERALADAAERTAELRRGGRRGPLHGVAVGVKDLIDVAGLPTRAGSHVLADAPPAAADAPVVARLRELGAVVVAKLHTHEFAYGPTGDVSASGPALNPHDPTRITGGSSSGSAVAIAAGHLALTIGTDTGASVRTPAALCGVAGLKPRYGALPTDGVVPLSETCDHVGLLAADADSLALAWETVAGEPAQPRPVKRVGVPVDAYWQAVDPELTAAVGTAVAALRAAGVDVVEVRTPMIEELAATYPVLVSAEAYATHRARLAERPGDYQPATLERLPSGGITAADYIDAQRTRVRLAREFLAATADVEALVLPTTRLRATPIGAGSVRVGGVDVPVRPSLLALTLPFNLVRTPAVSVPGPLPADGLPTAVQVAGTGLDERGVLALAGIISVMT